jgi:hypothetical protein
MVSGIGVFGYLAYTVDARSQSADSFGSPKLP